MLSRPGLIDPHSLLETGAVDATHHAVWHWDLSFSSTVDRILRDRHELRWHTPEAETRAGSWSGAWSSSSTSPYSLVQMKSVGYFPSAEPSRQPSANASAASVRLEIAQTPSAVATSSMMSTRIPKGRLASSVTTPSLVASSSVWLGGSDSEMAPTMDSDSDVVVTMGGCVVTILETVVGGALAAAGSTAESPDPAQEATKKPETMVRNSHDLAVRPSGLNSHLYLLSRSALANQQVRHRVPTANLLRAGSGGCIRATRDTVARSCSRATPKLSARSSTSVSRRSPNPESCQPSTSS